MVKVGHARQKAWGKPEDLVNPTLPALLRKEEILFLAGTLAEKTLRGTTSWHLVDYTPTIFVYADKSMDSSLSQNFILTCRLPIRFIKLEIADHIISDQSIYGEISMSLSFYDQSGNKLDAGLVYLSHSNLEEIKDSAFSELLRAVFNKSDEWADKATIDEGIKYWWTTFGEERPEEVFPPFISRLSYRFLKQGQIVKFHRMVTEMIYRNPYGSEF